MHVYEPPRAGRNAHPCLFPVFTPTLKSFALTATATRHAYSSCHRNHRFREWTFGLSSCMDVRPTRLGPSLPHVPLPRSCALTLVYVCDTATRRSLNAARRERRPYVPPQRLDRPRHPPLQLQDRLVRHHHPRAVHLVRAASARRDRPARVRGLHGGDQRRGRGGAYRLAGRVRSGQL